MEGKVIVSRKKVLGSKQIVVDSRFLTQVGNEVGKVISVSAVPFLTGTEVYQSGGKYSGKVNFKLIYVTEDGKLVSINNISDFEESVDFEDVGENARMSVNFKVVDVTTPSVKANEIKVACVMEALVTIEGVEYVDNASVDEGIFCKRKQVVEYESVAFKEAFEIEESIRINDELNNVLAVDSEICLKDAYAGNGFVQLNGDIFINIVYDTEKERLKCCKQTINFKQELAVESANIDSVVMANAYIQHNIIKVAVLQEDGFNTVKIEMPIISEGLVYNKVEIELLEDAYSEKSILETSERELPLLEQVYTCAFEDFVRESVQIPEVEGETKVLGFSGSNVTISSGYIEEDKLIIEGVVSGTVIFEADNQVSSIIAEVPFIVNNTKSEYRGLEMLEVVASLCDFDVNLKSANELELSAKINFYVSGVKYHTYNMLDSVQVGGEREMRDCAIEIIITSRESSLWELGKMLGVSAEQLLIHNPSLVDPVPTNERVVVYYPKVAN